MQASILIDQVVAVEWGLNIQQAALLSYLYEMDRWASGLEFEGELWCLVDQDRVVRDLPILSDKWDTIYRLLRQLKETGLVQMAVSHKRTIIRLSAKARRNRLDHKRGGRS